MKKITIGYIFNEPYIRTDEKLFMKVAKEKNIDLIMIKHIPIQQYLVILKTYQTYQTYENN